MGGYYINTFNHHHSPQESYKNCWFLVVAKYRKLKEYRSVSTAQVNVDLRLIAIKNTIQGRMITIWLSFTDCKKKLLKTFTRQHDSRCTTTHNLKPCCLAIESDIKCESKQFCFMIHENNWSWFSVQPSFQLCNNQRRNNSPQDKVHENKNYRLFQVEPKELKRNLTQLLIRPILKNWQENWPIIGPKPTPKWPSKPACLQLAPGMNVSSSQALKNSVLHLIQSSQTTNPC